MLQKLKFPVLRSFSKFVFSADRHLTGEQSSLLGVEFEPALGIMKILPNFVQNILNKRKQRKGSFVLRQL